MHVLLSTYGPRGEVDPVVGLAVQLRGVGAKLSACAAELVTAHFNSAALAAEGCDAPVATGVTPTGAWR